MGSAIAQLIFLVIDLKKLVAYGRDGKIVWVRIDLKQHAIESN